MRILENVPGNKQAGVLWRQHRSSKTWPRLEHGAAPAAKPPGFLRKSLCFRVNKTFLQISHFNAVQKSVLMAIKKRQCHMIGGQILLQNNDMKIK